MSLSVMPDLRRLPRALIRGHPNVVPTKAGNHKDWIPVSTGTPGFRLEFTPLQNGAGMTTYYETVSLWTDTNYREANDALSKKDFVHRVKITRKEAKESCYWLDLLIEANPEFMVEMNKLVNEAIELKKIFSSIIDRSS